VGCLRTDFPRLSLHHYPALASPHYADEMGVIRWIINLYLSTSLSVAILRITSPFFDAQRFSPSVSRLCLFVCLDSPSSPPHRMESGGIVLSANAGPRVPSCGVTHKRRCTYRPSVIYLIVNKLLSLSHTHTHLPLYQSQP
jgi:hypothetical protein